MTTLNNNMKENETRRDRLNASYSRNLPRGSFVLFHLLKRKSPRLELYALAGAIFEKRIFRFRLRLEN